MQFGIKTSPQNTTWQAMLDVWREADQIGTYTSGWTFDHFYPIFTDDPSGPCLEGWLTLTALAQATQRLRVGVLVTGMPYRHPTVLANMAATLDIISNGRLELGIGAGWNEEEAGAYGIDLGTLTERFDRFDEACEIITGLLTQHTTSFAGRYFTLTDAFCEPKPVQRPHPPICIGGTGEKRTLPAVARWAQHWNHPGASVAAPRVLCRHRARSVRDHDVHPPPVATRGPGRPGRAGRGVCRGGHGPRHRLHPAASRPGRAGAHRGGAGPAGRLKKARSERNPETLLDCLPTGR
jgi:F420-dependent oxidoreductase-like protein